MNQNKQQEIDPGVAYILWAFGLMGVCGVHRFYSGKIASGLIYLVTLGFFGVGQFVDLFLIPGMVKEKNIYLLHEATIKSLNNGHRVTLVEPQKPEIDPMLVLLQAAAKHNNVLSIGQAMLATQFSLEKVQPLLDRAIKQGLAHVDNDEKTGAMRYYFDV
ncbi:MAG: NINE protein [Cyanobacteria bacterium P01_G01_bin.19]